VTPLAPSAPVSPQLQPRLRAARQAFDSVAGDYDVPRGNNRLIQDMLGEMWYR
jgi:hypothetical protein